MSTKDRMHKWDRRWSYLKSFPQVGQRLHQIECFTISCTLCCGLPLVLVAYLENVPQVGTC